MRRLLLSALLLLYFPCACAASDETAASAAPEILLAETAPPGIDPSPYWVSEKLDGVRAVWDGRQLRLRSGLAVAAPEWFLAGLPPVPLDGELWTARGEFDRVSAIVRREWPDDEAWRAVRYMVFEQPGGEGDFSARLAALARIVAGRDCAWLQVVPQFRLDDWRALRRRLDEVVAAGGEGLMLHRADAPYLTGRQPVLLKLKLWHDAEARVVAHLPGRGRNRERLGALLVEMPDGRRFRLGSGLGDALREEPPALGSVVSYRYRSLMPGGLPRFPIYSRLRADLATQAMPGSIVGTSSAPR